MNLRPICALGFRCLALYLLWISFGYLLDLWSVVRIYVSLKPGLSIDSTFNPALVYLQMKYDSGVSAALGWTVFGYVVGWLFAAMLLWSFSIPLARVLTKNLDRL